MKKITKAQYYYIIATIAALGVTFILPEKITTNEYSTAASWSWAEGFFAISSITFLIFFIIQTAIHNDWQ